MHKLVNYETIMKNTAMHFEHFKPVVLSFPFSI